MFLAPSADEQTHNYDTVCSDYQLSQLPYSTGVEPKSQSKNTNIMNIIYVIYIIYIVISITYVCILMQELCFEF